MKLSRIINRLGPGLTAVICTAVISISTIGGTLMCISSCEKQNKTNVPDNHVTANEPVSVIDGHLAFDGQDSFERLFQAIGEDEDGTRAGGITLPQGFTSIAMRTEQLASKGTTGEESSEEEYLLAKSSDLLNDGRLTRLMDTDLVIEIGGTLYKITEEGTWAVKNATAMDLENRLSDIDKSMLKNVQKNETLSLAGGLEFANTFGEFPENDGLVMVADENTPVSSESMITVGDGKPSNNLHVGYGTTQYTWDASHFGEQILKVLDYRDYSKSVNFADNKHRVTVRLYDNNYIFVKVSGISVKFEEQKSFIGIKYWTEAKQKESMVLGVNYLQIEHKHPMESIGFLNFSPASLNMNGFNRSVNGVGTTGFLYGKRETSAAADSWGKQMILCVPKFGMQSPLLITKQTNELLRKMDDAKANADIVETLKKAAADSRTPKNPSIFIHPIPTAGNNETFTKTKTWWVGLREFNNTYKELIFFSGNFAPIGGISLRGTNISPTMPKPTVNMIKIVTVDAFGAVNYNGTWKGVRFVL